MFLVNFKEIMEILYVLYPGFNGSRTETKGYYSVKKCEKTAKVRIGMCYAL